MTEYATRHREIGAVMTPDVIRARPWDTYRDVARLLRENGISGVPVVDDDGRVLGVISETDLAGAPAGRADRLMTSPAVLAHAEDTVADVARVMAVRRIERLPVVDDEDRLIGIVTRSDLLQGAARSGV
ncbi:CBS domain-containing protein [Streptomyces sp. NPDC051940]|uniref:CBS domain-containing protein n=1 Tax=Streptomyces sp. NPDC051940 TaxID=3155675 RepID=UPI003443E39F